MKNALTATRTAEIRAAQNAYFMAKALEETIKAEAAEIKRKILEAGNYQIDDELWELLSPAEREAEPRRITDPEQDYEMGKEAFGEYLKKCYAEYLKAGIADKRGWEYCPEADAADARREAEKILLDLAIEILPEETREEYGETLKEATKHWKYREQILDLILRLDV